MKSILLRLEQWGDATLFVIRECGHEPDGKGDTTIVADMIPEGDYERALVKAIARGKRVGWRVIEATEEGDMVRWQPDADC